MSKPSKRLTMASKADRHRLYERSVQCVEAEIDFVDETFTDRRRRRAYLLREDFCGTAGAACEWVRRRKKNKAIGVDTDSDVLAWGRANNLAKFSPKDRRRIMLKNEDVLLVETERVDCVLAMNFSYWLFKDRKTMRCYFRRVRETLVDDGIFFLDAYGGYDAFRELREKTKHDGFTYIWHQESYNPITGETVCHIDFKFSDGSRLRKAFSYDWRLWTLAEIREILDEAGFSGSIVYWQGTDEETGDGSGEFFPTEVGEADPGWIAYIVVEK